MVMTKELFIGPEAFDQLRLDTVVNNNTTWGIAKKEHLAKELFIPGITRAEQLVIWQKLINEKTTDEFLSPQDRPLLTPDDTPIGTPLKEIEPTTLNPPSTTEDTEPVREPTLFKPSPTEQQPTEKITKITKEKNIFNTKKTSSRIIAKPSPMEQQPTEKTTKIAKEKISNEKITSSKNITNPKQVPNPNQKKGPNKGK